MTRNKNGWYKTKKFTITGVINTEAEANKSMTSVDGRIIHLLGIECDKSGTAANNDDYIKVYDEQQDLTEGGKYRDNIVDNFIPIDRIILPGHTITAANVSGATNRDVIGAYVYKLLEKLPT